MIRIQKELDCLGSTALITIVHDKDNPKAHRIIAEIIIMIEKFENSFSRFKYDSELVNFNKNAGQKTIISKEFINILKKCKQLSKDSDLAFNPFILPTLQKVGYSKSWKNSEIVSDQFKEAGFADVSKIEIGSDWSRIPFNTAIDFGGIGKGYMLDKISGFMKANSIENYWISLGGDLICRGVDINTKPWSVSVADALNDNGVIDSFTVEPNKITAIATSSIVKRKGYSNNKSWNHIINPKTLEPINSKILSATVVADSGVVADVMAKSIIINGEDFAIKIRENGEIKAFLLQNNDKTIRIEK